MIALKKPRHRKLDKPYWILFQANSTAKSFLEKYESIKGTKKGVASDNEQDLLRAMLTFSCAGLDATLKHLIDEALPYLFAKSQKSAEKAREYAKEKLLNNNSFNADLLSRALLSNSPRHFLVTFMIEDLKSHSLQSSREVLKIASFLGIDETVLAKKYKNDLNEVFQIRNKIIHEMDMDFSLANRSRSHRSREDMIKRTKIALSCGNEIISGVDKILSSAD